MGFFFKGISWFIKADVSVPADTKQLHIHTSGLPDDFVILCTCLIAILFQSVRHKGPCFVNIYMVKEIMIHKIAVALVIVAGKSLVLIQIHTCHPGKIQIPFFVPFYQLCIHAHRRGTGSQSKNCIRFHDNLCRHDIGCFSAYILIIFSCVNNHSFFLSSYSAISLSRSSLAIRISFFCSSPEISRSMVISP